MQCSGPEPSGCPSVLGTYPFELLCVNGCQTLQRYRRREADTQEKESCTQGVEEKSGFYERINNKGGLFQERVGVVDNIAH